MIYRAEYPLRRYENMGLYLSSVKPETGLTFIMVGKPNDRTAQCLYNVTG